MKLIVGNSLSQLEGLTTAHLSEVRKVLSYDESPESAHFSGAHKRHRRYLIDKRGFFPTGLLYLVEGLLEKHRWAHVTVDSRRRPESRPELFTSSLGVTPYPEQVDAARACQRAYRGIVAASTGTGKSLIAALIIEAVAVRTLLVVPSLELKRQLTESLSVIFGARSVGTFSQNRLIAVENIDSLDPTIKCGYDCIILDEFHHSAAKTYRDLNKKAWPGVFYRFGLTATPFRTNENERLLLESVLSKVIYRLEYSDAVKNGYIAPIEPYYVPVPRSSRPCEEFSYGAVYSELIVNKPERNALICDYIQALYEAKSSTLVLVNQIKHGELLQKMMSDRGYSIPFANGQDENSREMIRRFNAETHPVLIGSSILGEGVDTRPCEYVLLAGGPGKSRGALMQACGRAVRRFQGKESAKIISFYETGHKWFKKHHAFFVKTMKEEYGVTPAKIGS